MSAAAATAGRADLVVVGAGTMGAWTALEANRSGIPTTLVEAHEPGHSRATSGDETRIIRASHGEDRFYSRWSRTARERWIALGEEVGERLFVQAGALWFAEREAGFEAASLATLAALGIPVERLGPDELEDRWPQISADGLAFALHEPEAGLLMARRGVAAVARLFMREGGRFESSLVRPGKHAGRTLREVVADDGSRVSAGTFVFACGPWLPGLFPEVLGSVIRVTKQDVFFVGPPPGDHRFEAGSLPCWVDYDGPFYGMPSVEGRGMKAASDRSGPPFDPSSDDRIVDAATAALAKSFVERRFPALAGQPFVETRVCQYESTVDTHFVIDRHPDLDNVWLVGGGSGHGFKHGPVIGEHVVGRITGTAAAPDDDRFSVSRPREPRTGMRTGGDLLVSQ